MGCHSVANFAQFTIMWLGQKAKVAVSNFARIGLEYYIFDKFMALSMTVPRLCLTSKFFVSLG